MKKKQLAFVMAPVLATAMVVAGAAQKDDIVRARGGFSGGGTPTSGNVVYDNSTNLLGFLIDGIDEEWGDGVTLAGTERIVTNINLLIHANGGDATADVVVRIYDGGDNFAGGDPGALLWTSATFAGMSLISGTNPYDFAVPNVLVGDTMTWTLELSNVIAGGAVGSRFVDPPTLGSSEDNVWDHNGGVWTMHQFGIGAPNNFGARINAVGGGGLCGDANCDGLFNNFDIDPFFLALTDPPAWQDQYPGCNILNLDINGDGTIDGADIDPFFISLVMGGCP